MLNKIIPIKMGQYGTKHSHARGVLQVILENTDVDFQGVYEPDLARRDQLIDSKEEPWSKIKWLENKEELLDDPDIEAIASEGSNLESLDQTEEIVNAGKNVFYDKPAGDNYSQFDRIVSQAKEKGLLIQLGYMFRYHDGFEKISRWAKSGFLGNIFAVRAHMSTSVDLNSNLSASAHTGGIFYDLSGHVLDQIVWILGRPNKVTSFMRQDIDHKESFVDNGVAVLEYNSAIATVDIAAMEPSPTARRFEIYGDAGSVIMEPFEPADTLRLCITSEKDDYPSGISIIKLEDRRRYVNSLQAFIQDLRDDKQPDRSLDHELVVQETILRATGQITE